MKVKFILIASFLFLSTCSFAHAQSIDSITRRCKVPNNSRFAKILVQANGDIVHTPCPNRATEISGTTITDTGAIKLIDRNYVSLFGSTYFSIASTDRITHPTADGLVADDVTLPLTLNGTNKFYFGRRTSLDVQGSPSNPTVVGHSVNLYSNSFFPAGTGSLSGVSTSVDVGGQVSSAVGGNFGVLVGSGGAISVNTIRGVAGRAVGGYVPITTAIGGDFDVVTTVTAGSITDAYAIRAGARAQAGHTFTNLRYIGLGQTSTSAGTINNSYGIYADTTIDLGINRYFIYSDSTSPSRFAGDVRISDTTKGIILTSPDGTCYRFTVANGGVLSAGAAVTCQ